MKWKSGLIKAAVMAIACDYLAFLLLDFIRIGTPASTCLKFLGVALCALIALASGGLALSRRDLALLRLGLFLTLAADGLLLLGNWALPGVLVFCAVQATHALRYSAGQWRRIVPWLLAIFLLGGAAILAGVLSGRVDVLTGASALYALLLLTSLTQAVLAARARRFPAPNRGMIVAGMVLFLLCDSNVALFNLSAMGTMLNAVSVRIIWLFYLPSQALLALSGLAFRRENF